MRGGVKGCLELFPKIHPFWYHDPSRRHSIQNSADCAVKNTVLVLETTKKLKKVENVSACSSRCNQEPSCEFYKWKVKHICRKTFTVYILVTGPGQQESKSSRVPFDVDILGYLLSKGSRGQAMTSGAFWLRVGFGSGLTKNFGFRVRVRVLCILWSFCVIPFCAKGQS